MDIGVIIAIVVGVIVVFSVVPMLIKAGKGGGGGAFAAFMFRDDAERARLANERARLFAPVIGGTVKSRDDGGEIHVTGQLDGRAVRLVIDVTFGGTSFEVMAQRHLAHLSLRFDAEAAKHAHESESRDAWDDHDRSDQKFFLSPHVFFEGDPDDLRSLKGAWEQIPEPARNALLALMEADGAPGTFVTTTGKGLMLKLSEKLTFAADAPARIAPHLRLLIGATLALEGHTTRVEAAENVAEPHEDLLATTPLQRPVAPVQAGGPLGTVKLDPRPALAGPIGAGSPVTVVAPDGSWQSATVVQAQGGHYLCLFPNGQQHWVPAQNIAPP
jgi:hypothetical protein